MALQGQPWLPGQIGREGVPLTVLINPVLEPLTDESFANYEGCLSVPDVRGESQSAATSQLKAAGFAVDPSTQMSSSVTAGNVISQDPAAGQQATVGSTVTIVVAKRYCSP